MTKEEAKLKCKKIEKLLSRKTKGYNLLTIDNTIYSVKNKSIDSWCVFSDNLERPISTMALSWKIFNELKDNKEIKLSYIGRTYSSIRICREEILAF